MGHIHAGIYLQESDVYLQVSLYYYIERERDKKIGRIGV